VNVFIPKGENEDDAVEVIREATETRPLGLKSTDNKIIGAVWNISAKNALSSSACRIQRGFTPGRQMIENVMNLDTHARIFGSAGHCHFGDSEVAPVTTRRDTVTPGPIVLPPFGGDCRRSSTLVRKPDRKTERLASGRLCPLLAFWDFAAAFPSVLHVDNDHHRSD
jgi:hypothetical protein